jgi:hypothetical protein
MHMWHHVTNHLIISTDKDSNSENRIKLRVRDNCDPQQLLHNMLANREFHGDFNYIPFREFDTKKRRHWRDFMSGNWAWKEANNIAQDPATHGTMLVPLILGSDKTTVSVATGQNEYYPLYLSISNIRNHVRHAHGNVVVVLGFLAIPKSRCDYYSRFLSC